MTRKHLLLGISTAALAAGTAVAQNTNTVDASGNREIVNCTTNSGNACDVDNQFPGNDRNFGFVSASGTNNNLTITQRGDDNSATIEANGDNNRGRTNQTGDDHRADTDMTGANNTSLIDQGDEDNSATVIQVNTATATAAQGNSSNIAQGAGVGTAGTAGATANFAGENNVASVNQNGSRLTSAIQQASTGGAASADNNTATVTQLGTGSSSTVTQSSSGNIATVRMTGGGANNTTGNRRNESIVTQTNTVLIGDVTTTATDDFTAGTPSNANNPNGNNQADVLVESIQNSSTVRQNGVNNFARVSITGGGLGNTGATVVAGQTPASNPENFGPNGQPLPADRREGNTSDLDQVGQNLTYRASIGARDPVTGTNGRGNLATVRQGSTGNLASGHTTFMFQRGTLDTATVNQDNNVQGGVSTGGSVANIAQSSFGSTATVTQVGSNDARVSQGLNANGSGGQNNVTINQTDAGDVTSGGTTGTDPFGGGGTNPVTSVSRNNAIVSQSGTGNTATVRQNGFNASATVFQRRDSVGGSVVVNQGVNQGFGSGTVPGATTGTSRDVIATVRQGGEGGMVRVRQDGRDLRAEVNQNNLDNALRASTASVAGQSNPVAQISQVGRANGAVVTQEGINTTATVDQRFDNGTAAANSARIDQQGGDQNGGNIATIRQGTGTVTSGRSASTDPASGTDSTDGDFRGAGARSAEAIIFQSNTGIAGEGGNNSATIEQRGRGQFARISQTGSNNTAGILQTETATNAGAVIVQTGRNNQFFITQDTAGQFLRVTQNGTANNVVTGSGPSSAGPGGGVGGVGSGTVAPGFTATP